MCSAAVCAMWVSQSSEQCPCCVPSIEYWFRCMDLDGDGVLSMYELEFFYEEQCERMEVMGIEPLPFQDLLCQMLDLVKPEREGESWLGRAFTPFIWGGVEKVKPL